MFLRSQAEEQITRRSPVWALFATALFFFFSVSGCVKERLQEEINATAFAEEVLRHSSHSTATAEAAASMTPVFSTEIDTTPPAEFSNPIADPDITPFPTFSSMSMSSLEPRPSFISAIAPREYTKIPRDIYNTTQALSFDESAIHLSDLGVVTEDGPIYRASICVRPRAEYLVQPDDIFAPEGVDVQRFAARMDLFVDEKHVDGPPLGYGGTYVVDRVAGTAYMENRDYCWRVPLDVGQHRVTLRFNQTSGHVNAYTWYFEIVQ